MISTRLRLGRLLPFLCGGHRQLALENLALRHQLAVDKRTILRPRLRRTDRLWWVWLARVWTGWRAALVIVAPDTVLRWQRRRFREHWTPRSGRPTGGRPPVNAEIKALVTRMAAANLNRMSDELGGLYRQLAAANQHKSEFLANHVQDLVALDFFTVPTASLRVFFVLVVLAPPAPARRPRQRDRASHRGLDRLAARGHLPGRHRAILPPPRSRPRLQPHLSATSRGHGDPRSAHGPPQLHRFGPA